MRLAMPAACGDLAHHLADALPGVDPRPGSSALLPAGEQRAGAALADVQGQEPGELGPDRHLAPLAALAVLDGDHPLGKADVLDPEGGELRDPGSGLEQGLHHQPDLAASGVGLVDEAQLLLEAQPGGRALPRLGRLEPGLLARGLEHRLGLQVVEPLAGEEGGDRCRRPARCSRAWIGCNVFWGSKLASSLSRRWLGVEAPGRPARGSGFSSPGIVENPASGTNDAL